MNNKNIRLAQSSIELDKGTYKDLALLAEGKFSRFNELAMASFFGYEAENSQENSGDDNVVN